MRSLSLFAGFAALLCFCRAIEVKPMQSVKATTKAVEIDSDASFMKDAFLSPEELAKRALEAAQDATDNLHPDIDADVARIIKHYKFLKETVKQLGHEKRKRQESGQGASLMQREESAQPGSRGTENYPQPGAGPRQTQPDYKAGYYTGFYQGYYTGYQQVKNYTSLHPKDANSTATAAKIKTLSMEDIQNTEASVGAVNSYVSDYETNNGLNQTRVGRSAKYESDKNADTALFLVLYIAIGIVATCAMCLAFVGLVAVERKYAAKKAAEAAAKAEAAEHVALAAHSSSGKA